MDAAGSGKSSILRVLRGLWKPLRGLATLCPDSSHHYVMFLPQKPHLTSGSLAEQVRGGRGGEVGKVGGGEGGEVGEGERVEGGGVGEGER